MCTNCQSNNRNIWGPSVTKLNLEIIDSGNWINLNRCGECGALWVESYYEPYMSFPYWVKWSYPATYWRIVHDFDAAKSLHDWLMLEIKKLWSSLPKEEKAAIEIHRRRTSNYHNPIDYPVKREINIEKIVNATTKYCSHCRFC